MFYPDKQIPRFATNSVASALNSLFLGGFALIGFTTEAFAQYSLPSEYTQNQSEINSALQTAQLNQKTLQNIQELSSSETDIADSVTSVSQLSDVKSTDWAFTALQSLVERYGCIAGYPDSTFRGKQAVSRYEFAAGLNACLDKINEIIATGLADKVSQEDLATLQSLQENFGAELATLRGRIDGLDAKITKLETQQFSTTTKLYGQAIFGLQGRFGNSSDINFRDGIRNINEADQGTNITFGYNLGLSLLTQFDAANRSILLVSLSASNLSLGSGISPLRDSYTLLGYEGNTNNQFLLSDLSYRFRVSDKAAFIVGAAGVSPSAVFRGPNRIESSGSGPLSAFAQRNPILGLGGGRAGVGFDWQVSDRVSLQGVYAAGDPANPTTGGLTGGSYVTGLQATLAPTDNLDAAIYYLHAYTTGGSLNTGIGDSTISFLGSSFLTDAIGATLDWRISPAITLGTWGGFTKSNAVIGDTGSVETTNWMVYLNFPDLFKQGNLAGIYVGQPPKITSSNLSFGNIPSFIGLDGVAFGTPGSQPASTTHVELFYLHRITDRISITPGVIFLFNPVQTATSDTITIGTIRTTFSF
ncbi:iron uptake porin [Pseudanabaena mucicola]|uniref:Carbohydrate porin n=1 Tax=Pseudanabaena mucicola FACHB-723 TaxID=2692860 RepID=A0ABR7ZVB6_9CYAN|nr:iron uptake porin [Pseudanabaena mucicola]MBD2187705.1 carbohydrate porin [Pseudanabaena mucicola FACHB-723]